MYVNANVINDEDSGNSGYYWAMDTFNRVIKVWQTGASNYTINFTDSGSSFIPAGAHSPQNGILEPVNGIATMNGQQSWIVIGTFNALAVAPNAPNNGFITPSSLTGNTPLGTYNAFGTIADLLSSTQNGGVGSVSNTLNFVNSYFSNAPFLNVLNEYQPGFTYTYTYNSPLGVQTWIDTSNTAVTNFGDIITGPLINVMMNVKNDEDASPTWGGYWALDNYTKNIKVWQIGANTFYTNVTYSGTWNTFANALSPVYEIKEPVNGGGAYTASYNGVFTGNLLPTFGANAIGNIGTYVFGGTENDILSSNQIGDTSYTNWMSFYFSSSNFDSVYTNPSVFSANFIYTYNTPIGTEVSSNNWFGQHTGDIITGPAVNVIIPVNNLPDQGQNGAWALDTVNTTLQVFQTGTNSFVATFSYNGIAHTFAGLRSPGSYNAIEPLNGIIPFTGNAIFSFNGVLLSTPTANTMGTLPLFDDGASLSGNAIVNSTSTLSVGDQYLKPLENYFDASSMSFDGNTLLSSWYLGLGSWSFSYANGTYPAGANSWTEGASSGTTLRAYNGEIMTGPIVNITADIINNPDSGNYGYWALDNFVRKITVYQTSANSFVMNFADNGLAYTFAGVNSLGAGIPEPYNGVVQFTGYASTPFNGVFSPGSNAVATNGMLIGTFNNNGAPVGNTIDITNSISTFEHYIDMYFTGATNYEPSTWSWTYTNATYPANENKWVDAYTGISGEIITPIHVTGTHATTKVSLPSNTLVNLNYTSAGAVLSIKSSGSNTITANILIANLTSTASSSPSSTGTTFTKLVVLNISSDVVSNSITYGLTVGYPCGSSNAAPYKQNATTGSWVAITPFTRNTTGAPALCTMSFNIPPDPVIGLFSSAPTPIINSGGGVPTPVGPAPATTTATTVTPTIAPTTVPAPTTVAPPVTVTRPTTVAAPTTSVAPAASATPSAFSSELFGIIAGIVVIAVVAAWLYLRRKGRSARKQERK